MRYVEGRKTRAQRRVQSAPGGVLVVAGTLATLLGQSPRDRVKYVLGRKSESGEVALARVKKLELHGAQRSLVAT